MKDPPTGRESMSALWSDRLQPEVVRACNRLHGGLHGADGLPMLTDEDGAWRVARIDPLRAPRPALRSGIRLGRWSATIGIDSPASWNGIGDIAWRTVAPPLRAVVLGTLLRPVLDWLKALSGESAVIDAASPVPGTDDSHTVAFEFRRGADASEETSRGLVLSMPSAAWQAVGDRVDESSVRARASRLPLRLRIELPSQSLRREELSHLRPGDLVRIGTPLDASGRPLRLNLALGRRVLFQCRLGASDLTVERIAADPGSGPMNKDNAVKNLDQLELPVSFQLGTLAVSLEELGRIGPGHTFTTQLATAQPVVSILVDGQKVGSGRLMAVGDLVGVQVLDWV